VKRGLTSGSSRHAPLASLAPRAAEPQAVRRRRCQRKVMALARGNAGGDGQVRPGANAGGGA